MTNDSRAVSGFINANLFQFLKNLIKGINIFLNVRKAIKAHLSIGVFQLIKQSISTRFKLRFQVSKQIVKVSNTISNPKSTVSKTRVYTIDYELLSKFPLIKFDIIVSMAVPSYKGGGAGSRGYSCRCDWYWFVVLLASQLDFDSSIELTPVLSGVELLDITKTYVAVR